MIFSFLLALLFQLFISTTWGYDKVCDKVTVNIEINFKSVEIDPYCCAKNFLVSENLMTVFQERFQDMRSLFVNDERRTVDGSV